MDFLSADSLPWLLDAQQRLRSSIDAGRLPQSLLLLAVPGLGAQRLTHWITALALCERPSARPCDACASCRLLRSDTHPDVHVVHLEEDAQQIKVDQVRELIESLALKSYRGGYKVGVIEDGETLNTHGANAFLKTLEEPAPNTLLIIVARPNHRLPATIVSRCMRLTLRPPATEVAMQWLHANATAANAWHTALTLAGGAPLLALELANQGLAEIDADMRHSIAALGDGTIDITLLAERWIRTNPGLRITWLENWITQRLHVGLEASASHQTAEPIGLPAALLKAKIRALFELLDAARDVRRLASTGMNQQLALEALLVGGRTALAK